MTAVLDLDVARVWRFTIPDAPVAAARPRVAVRGGRAHGYTPTRTSEAVWRIREHVTAELGPTWSPLSGPIRLTATVWLPQPASIPKRDRLTARPARRPDLDNFAKTALDGLSPLWLDDAQVVELLAEKRYAVASPPRWEITVEAIHDRRTAAVLAGSASVAGSGRPPVTSPGGRLEPVQQLPPHHGDNDEQP